jgi:hypothetical protein
MTIQIKHRDTGAVLHTVEAGTLSGADLRGANLSEADLNEAVIKSDKLNQLLARVTRVSDGHEFFLFSIQNGPPKIKAGCRWLTIPEYQDHIAESYLDTDKAQETLRILDYFTKCIHDYYTKVQKDALSISNS